MFCNCLCHFKILILHEGKKFLLNLKNCSDSGRPIWSLRKWPLSRVIHSESCIHSFTSIPTCARAALPCLFKVFKQYLKRPAAASRSSSISFYFRHFFSKYSFSFSMIVYISLSPCTSLISKQACAPERDFLCVLQRVIGITDYLKAFSDFTSQNKSKFIKCEGEKVLQTFSQA